jgi:hypothetical protein
MNHSSIKTIILMKFIYVYLSSLWNNLEKAVWCQVVTYNCLVIGSNKGLEEFPEERIGK